MDGAVRKLPTLFFFFDCCRCMRIWTWQIPHVSLRTLLPRPTKSPKDLSQFAFTCTPPISVGQEEKFSDTAGLQVRLSLPQTPASLSRLTPHPRFLLLHPPSLVDGRGFRTQLCDPVVVARTRTLVHTEPFMTTDLPAVDSPITFQELESDVPLFFQP